MSMEDEVVGKDDGIWTDGDKEGDGDDSTLDEPHELASPAAQQSYITSHYLEFFVYVLFSSVLIFSYSTFN